MEVASGEGGEVHTVGEAQHDLKRTVFLPTGIAAPAVPPPSTTLLPHSQELVIFICDLHWSAS